MFLDVLVERAQRAEDLRARLVIGTQLDLVLPGKGEGDFQRIDRVQTEPLPEERRARRDVLGADINIERGHDQPGQLELVHFQRKLVHAAVLPGLTGRSTAPVLPCPGSGSSRCNSCGWSSPARRN